MNTLLTSTSAAVSSGTELVAAKAGYRIRVYGAHVVASGSDVVTLEEDAGATAKFVLRAGSSVASGQFVSAADYIFDTGDGLNLSYGGTGTVTRDLFIQWAYVR